MAIGTLTALREWAGREAAAYKDGQPRPLGGYLAMMGIYGAGTAVAAAGTALARRALPERVSAADLIPMVLTTHKLARIIAKDPITTPLRVPFTTFHGTSAPGELSEEVRGEGLRHAAGELLTCPMCLAQWVATGLVLGLVAAPRTTRLVMATFTAVAGSDFLQHIYAWLQQES